MALAAISALVLLMALVLAVFPFDPSSGGPDSAGGAPEVVQNR